jgi:hypothetical protein
MSREERIDGDASQLLDKEQPVHEREDVPSEEHVARAGSAGMSKLISFLNEKTEVIFHPNSGIHIKCEDMTKEYWEKAKAMVGSDEYVQSVMIKGDNTVVDGYLRKCPPGTWLLHGAKEGESVDGYKLFECVYVYPEIAEEGRINNVIKRMLIGFKDGEYHWVVINDKNTVDVPKTGVRGKHFFDILWIESLSLKTSRTHPGITLHPGRCYKLRHIKRVIFNFDNTLTFRPTIVTPKMVSGDKNKLLTVPPKHITEHTVNRYTNPVFLKKIHTACTASKIEFWIVTYSPLETVWKIMSTVIPGFKRERIMTPLRDPIGDEPPFPNYEQRVRYDSQIGKYGEGIMTERYIDQPDNKNVMINNIFKQGKETKDTIYVDVIGKELKDARNEQEPNTSVLTFQNGASLVTTEGFNMFRVALAQFGISSKKFSGSFAGEIAPGPPGPPQSGGYTVINLAEPEINPIDHIEKVLMGGKRDDGDDDIYKYKKYKYKYMKKKKQLGL